MAVTPKYNIYYPTDYTAIADIPANMQEMAESIEDGIDEAIGNIETILHTLNVGSGVE